MTTINWFYCLDLPGVIGQLDSYHNNKHHKTRLIRLNVSRLFEYVQAFLLENIDFFILQGILYKYSLLMIFRPRKIAYRTSTKRKVDMLYYKIDVSIKYSESKGYNCYIILKMMKIQVDAMQCLHLFWFTFS